MRFKCKHDGPCFGRDKRNGTCIILAEPIENKPCPFQKAERGDEKEQTPRPMAKAILNIERVEELRYENELTCQQLSKLCGMNKKWYETMKRNGGRTSYGVAVKLQEVFGVDMEEFVSELHWR